MFLQHKPLLPIPHRKFFLAFCALTTLLLAALWPFNTPHLTKVGADGLTATASAAGPAQGAATGCCEGEGGDNKPHHLAGSYYTLKDGFSAKLLLNNKGPAPIVIQPTLFSMSGERFEAPHVTVDGNTHQFVDLAVWAAAAGEQFQEGSLQLFHRGKDLVLGSQIYLTDEAHSLSFEEKLSEPATVASSLSGGVWWLPSPKGAVGLVVSNTTDAALSVTAKVRGASPKREADTTFTLMPHETKVLDVQHDLTGHVRGAMSSYGYLSVEHDGPRGGVVARAMARDADSGFSLPVQFYYPKSGKSNSLQGAGLRIGSARSEPLSPKVVAHNAGETATTLSGRVPYTTADGANGEVILPQLELAPGQTEVIDVAQSLAAHGVRRNVAAAGLEFEYTGEPGRVVTSAFSVSRGGNQVFRVPLWDIAAQRSATGGYPWYIEGDSSTLVYIKNVTDQPRHYSLQLRHDGGVYALGLKQIEPRQTQVIDIRALRDQQVPDERGHTLPPEASSGQVNWSMRGDQNQVLIGRSEQADLARGTSSNYACMNCCPDSFAGGWVDPGGETLFIGDSALFTAFEQTSNCYGSYNQPYAIWPYWDSTNWYVASCDGGGWATGQNAGEAWMQGSWMAYEWGSFESGNPNECYPRERNALVSALLDVLAHEVRFLDVELMETGQRAEFDPLFNRAVLNLSSTIGPNACAGERFKLKVRFSLMPGADCCVIPHLNFTRLSDNNKFQYAPQPDGTIEDFFGNDRPPFVIVYLRQRSGGTSNSLFINVGGSRSNGTTYTDRGVVRLNCP